MRTVEVAAGVVTLSALLDAYRRVGVCEPDAVRILGAAEDRGIAEWCGMSERGEPVFRLRTPVYLWRA